jgi:hypothetical protein
MMTDQEWDRYKAYVVVEEMEKYLVTKYFDSKAIYEQMSHSRPRVDRIDFLYWVLFYLERVSLYSYLPKPKNSVIRVYSHNGSRFRTYISFGDSDIIGGNMKVRMNAEKVVNIIADDWKDRNEKGEKLREEGYFAKYEAKNYYYVVWYFTKEEKFFKPYYVVEFPKSIFDVKWIKDEIDFVLERLI